MTYVKLLTALTALVLLTACAGGVTINANSTVINNTLSASCLANPFVEDCAPTPAQEVSFCRDLGRNTDTKATDCAPVAIRVCDANVFDDLCPAPPTVLEQDAFCRDATKPTFSKARDCAQIITNACTTSFDDPICNGIQQYEDLRIMANNECLAQGKSQPACDAEALVRRCTADPFAMGCDESYNLDREGFCLSNKNSSRCIATEERICGEGGNIFDVFCTGLTATNDSRKTACESGNRTRGDCTATITRICGADGNIFDAFCTGLPTTNDDRQMACESGVKTRDECMPTVLRICGAGGNIFDAFCADIASYYPAQKLECESGERGRGDCVATVARICTNGNIFDNFCTGLANTDNLRQTACESGVKTRGDCIPTVTRICGANSLDPFCADVASYYPAQKMECESGEKTRSDCTATVARICDANSLDEFCRGLTAYYPMQRMDCEGGENRNREECRPTIMRLCETVGEVFGGFCDGLTLMPREISADENTMLANYADWVAVLGPHATAFTPLRNQFLQTTDTAGVIDLGGNVPDSTVNFANVTFERARLSTVHLATNGFVYYQADASSPSYLGLLPTTNLGAPITETMGMAVWQGVFSLQGATKDETTFELTVHFSSEIEGQSGRITGTGKSDYVIGGGFDSRGVISGEVTKPGTDPAVLSGLIGQVGAIAVFASNPATGFADGFSGGFVAVPDFPVEATFGFWNDAFTEKGTPLRASTVAPTAGNKFVQGNQAGLNQTGFTAGSVVANSFNLNFASYSGIQFGRDAADGVAFQYGTIAGRRYFYAGLLSGTNLGEPLSAVTSATWYGRIVILQDIAWYGTAAGEIVGDIDLTVNYDGSNNGTIGGRFGEYTVKGTFDSNGIMGGSVERAKTHTYRRTIFAGNSGRERREITRNEARKFSGPLTGLIGQTEAVGVFIGQDFTTYDDRERTVDVNDRNFKYGPTNAGFAGGFVARSTQPTN